MIDPVEAEKFLLASIHQCLLRMLCDSLRMSRPRLYNADFDGNFRGLYPDVLVGYTPNQITASAATGAVTLSAQVPCLDFCLLYPSMESKRWNRMHNKQRHAKRYLENHDDEGHDMNTRDKKKQSTFDNEEMIEGRGHDSIEDDTFDVRKKRCCEVY